MQRSKTALYSMTSSASASRVGGSVSPSALAVVRLMTRSNLVGCSTGLGRVTASAPTTIALAARMRPAGMPQMRRPGCGRRMKWGTKLPS